MAPLYTYFYERKIRCNVGVTFINQSESINLKKLITIGQLLLVFYTFQKKTYRTETERFVVHHHNPEIVPNVHGDNSFGINSNYRFLYIKKVTIPSGI